MSVMCAIVSVSKGIAEVMWAWHQGFRPFLLKQQETRSYFE